MSHEEGCPLVVLRDVVLGDLQGEDHYLRDPTGDEEPSQPQEGGGKAASTFQGAGCWVLQVFIVTFFNAVVTLERKKISW